MKTSKMFCLALIAMILTLCLGTSVFAENAAQPEEAANPVENGISAEEEALLEALNAYHTAQNEAYKQELVNALKEEMEGYVSAGTMTAEQAELVLNFVTERPSPRGEARPNGPQSRISRGNGPMMSGMPGRLNRSRLLRGNGPMMSGMSDSGNSPRMLRGNGPMMSGMPGRLKSYRMLRGNGPMMSGMSDRGNSPRMILKNGPMMSGMSDRGNSPRMLRGNGPMMSGMPDRGNSPRMLRGTRPIMFLMPSR